MCIRDRYNWSYKAESNFENVIITNNDTILAEQFINEFNNCLLYTSDAADERSSVDLGGRRIIKKKKNI